MIALAVAIKNARLQAIADAIDTAATAGSLTLYSGAQPAGGAAITDQVALAVIAFADPAVDSIDNALLTFAAFPEVMAIANGTATWGRIIDGDGGFVLDGDVGITGSGALFQLDNPALFKGGIVRGLSAVLAEP